jgi:hypothetical protein
MKTAIVTTGEFYARLLERLLTTVELPPFVVVGGAPVSSGALMLAASIRRSHDMPVAAVVNSDTVEPALIAEQQEMREYLMRGGASPGIPSRFIPAVPQVEAVLFSDSEALGCILGRRLTEREIIEGEFRPRAVLDRLLVEAGMDRDALLEKISPKAAARFAAHPLIRSLAQFVEEASSAVTEAAA